MKYFTFSFLLMLSPLFLIAHERDSIGVEDVPFAIIDQAPIFPGCEKLDNSLQKLCLQNQIKSHVNKNFNLNFVSKLNLEPGKKKIYVRFIINKEGIIEDVKARGPHKELELEGIRVIKSLPNMIPGKHKDKTVGVKYVIPITFLVDLKTKKKRKRKKS